MSISAEGAPPAIAAFVRNFYRLSDDPTAHQDYVDSFDYYADTLFQIGPMAPVSTSQGVLDWRHKAWEPVAARKHTVYDVYSKAAQQGGGAETEYMLHGRVDYEKKDGSKAGATWAGRMVFEPKSLQAGQPKMSFYRVWIVSGSMLAGRGTR